MYELYRKHSGQSNHLQAPASYVSQAQRDAATGTASQVESAQIARRWATPLPAASRILSAVLQKLERLKQLEDDHQNLLEHEKLAAMKQLAYGASHEINNPLANIATRAESLLRDEMNPERQRMLAAIHSQAFRAHEMISDLMLFAHPPKIDVKPIGLLAAIRMAIDEISQSASEQQTTIVDSTGSEEIEVLADENQLVIALKAVLKNSLEALGTGGEVEIQAWKPALAEANGQRSIHIQIQDTGPGFSAEVRRHIFDPFFSGREAGRGLGFGLSKCWRIIQQHGGSIDVQSESDGGAMFVILLPAEAVVESKNRWTAATDGSPFATDPKNES